MPIFVGNSTVNTAVANSTLTVDQTQNFAYATSNRNSIRPSLSLDFTRSQTVDPRITFARASSATYFNSLGALSTAANNVPRIDYNPITGVCNGLLIEQQSTNLLLNSASLSTQSVTTSATTYTLSFYGTGTVALSGTYTGSLVGTGAFPTRSTLTFTATAGTLTLTVTGTVSYAQLEALAFVTSYITTTGATATRIVDQTSLTGTNFSSWYNTTNWTAIVTAVPAKIPNPSASLAQSIFEFRLDGGNRILARINSSSSVITAYWINSLSLPSNGGGYNSSALTSNTAFKYGITASNGSWNLAFNGSVFISAAVGYLITPTELWIGYSPNDTLGFTGWIQRIAYYPVVLPNAELQTLTS